MGTWREVAGEALHPPRPARDRRHVHRGRRRRRHAHPARPRHAALRAEGGDFPCGTPQRPTAELIAEGVLVDVPGVFPTTPRRRASPPSSSRTRTSTTTASRITRIPAIPVYGSEGTLAILEVGRVFFPDAALPADLRLLPDGEPLRFGGLTVTGIPVDHAAPDSRALLVEADGQRLLYTGDLRAHGRTGFRFEKLLADERAARRRLAALEGTTLGVAQAATACAARPTSRRSWSSWRRDEPDKLVAVVASGQNLDRLVSCFRAARRAGRLLVIDPYQAYVLLQLAPLSPNIPQFDWDGVRVELRAPPGRAAQGGRAHGPRPRDERSRVELRAPWPPTPAASSCARAAATA